MSIQVSFDLSSLYSNKAIDAKSLPCTLGTIENVQDFRIGGKFKVSGLIPTALIEKRVGTTGKEFCLLDIAFKVSSKATEHNPNHWADVLQECFWALVKMVLDFDPSRGNKIQTVGFHYCNRASRDYMRKVRKTDPTYILGSGRHTLRELMAQASTPSEKRMKKLASLGLKAIAGDERAKRTIAKILAFQTRTEYLYNAETVELKAIRAQGIETLDSIVPKGVWIQLRLASHEPVISGKENEVIEPTDRTDDELRHAEQNLEEFEAFKAKLNPTELEWLEKHLAGKPWTTIAREQELNPNTGARMGEKIMKRVETFWRSRSR